MATIYQKFNTQFFEIQAPVSPTVSVILLIPSLNTLVRITKGLVPPFIYLIELY
jgi:hypothetical protein